MSTQLGEIVELVELLAQHRHNAPYPSLKPSTAAPLIVAFDSLSVGLSLSNAAYGARQDLGKVRGFRLPGEASDGERSAYKALLEAAEVRFADALLAEAERTPAAEDAPEEPDVDGQAHQPTREDGP